MAEKKKRVVPRGKALERTPGQLDELTSVKALMELAEEAEEEFREEAPRGFKTLLDNKDAK